MKKLHPAIFLFIIAILAYGLLIPTLGFYWDDLPMSWIRYELGPEAMTQYFSSNRPVWALLYQVTTRIFPHQPLYWQIFALFWRWLGAVVLWAIVRQLLPQRGQLAFSLSALFLLYPGFNQQSVSYLYSHFFIVLFFFLYSYYLMLRGKTLPALLFSALNLWMMEYFYVLELIRPFLILFTLRHETSPLKKRLWHTFKQWWPYGLLFTLAVLSRLFIFNNQVYTFSIREQIALAPLDTIVSLLQSIANSLWLVTVAAWSLIFKLPTLEVDGPRTIALYAGVVLLVAVTGLLGLKQQAQTMVRGGGEALWLMFLGLILLGLAGPPFWLTNVPVSLGFPANRATLSFMLGATFMLAGMLEFIPQRARMGVVVVLIAFAAGRQFLWSNEFRRDWAYQKNLFWQMTWRAPGIKENTMVLLNENVSYYADNSLSSALNWVYSSSRYDGSIEYVLFYPTNRENLVLQPNTPVTYDFLAGVFEGNTSQTLAFYYDPPKCLRLLDPEIDPYNRLLPEETQMREAALLSSTHWVTEEAIANMPKAYSPEPAQTWCYYFQKAELARQLGDWSEVARLGGQAFALRDTPNDPLERFVFIEGYAHIADWEKAVELSTTSYKVSRSYVGPLLCLLWGRIERETAVTPEQAATLQNVYAKYGCSP